jgi:hypothetical protein
MTATNTNVYATVSIKAVDGDAVRINLTKPEFYDLADGKGGGNFANVVAPAMRALSQSRGVDYKDARIAVSLRRGGENRSYVKGAGRVVFAGVD